MQNTYNEERFNGTSKSSKLLRSDTSEAMLDAGGQVARFNKRFGGLTLKRG